MITKQPLENLCSETKKIIKSSETIENQCLKIIQLFKPFYSTIEKPAEKIWEIKKVFMNCIERNGISGNSDDYMKYYVMIDKELTELLLEETMKHEHYYKNILTEESFDMFEKIVTLLQGEIQFFYENLIYTQKIFDFINEFNRDGVFPTDLLFLKTFLATASSNMILIACELLEELSLMYFQGKDIGGYNFIRYQGFKKAICQNLIMDNIQKLDIETYFDYLRCRQTL